MKRTLLGVALALGFTLVGCEENAYEDDIDPDVQVVPADPDPGIDPVQAPPSDFDQTDDLLEGDAAVDRDAPITTGEPTEPMEPAEPAAGQADEATPGDAEADADVVDEVPVGDTP